MMKTTVLALAATAALIGVGAAHAAAPAGDIAKGKTLFDQQCSLCHSVAAGQEGQAPNLRGIVGRKAGADPGFTAYTTAIKSSHKVWSSSTLDVFLSGPAKYIPGTAMPITVANPSDRQNVIAYLSSLKK
jgi:cytochrome c2